MLTKSGIGQSVNSRPFAGDDDFWRVRDLLIETYPITPTGFNWDIRRWDGWNHHGEPPPDRDNRVHLWETDDHQLVGAAHPEGQGDVYLEVHPDYRHLEDEMLTWAEANLAVASDDSQQRRLDMFVYDYDTPRRRLLVRRGYTPMPWSGVTRRLRLDYQPLAPVKLAEGYIMRGTRPNDDGDCQRIADLLNAAFNRTMHTREEFCYFAVHSPSFRHDLNLVAEAGDGAFAALVGVTYDEVNRRGIFEPVCTHLDHRRKGLARALMTEGLHRLKALGAADVYVETGDAVPANELYDAVGFTEAYKGYIWRKVF